MASHGCLSEKQRPGSGPQSLPHLVLLTPHLVIFSILTAALLTHTPTTKPAFLTVKGHLNFFVSSSWNAPSQPHICMVLLS